ncbi:MAG: hypothetical protein JKY97_11400 [Citromicrobium sp.]|nr:hypothetical protein [Citromicrobium sp.]
MASDSQPHAVDARATYPPITTIATTLALIQNQREVLPCPSVLQSRIVVFLQLDHDRRHLLEFDPKRYTSPLDAFDIYAVDGKKGLVHHNDDHFDGRGLWITHGIPPGEITLIEPGKWHDLYRAMYVDDDPEFTRNSAEKAPI